MDIQNLLAAVLVLATCIINTIRAHNYNCVPRSKNALHAMLQEGVSNQDEHASIYLLPAYLNVLTARGKHHGRWGCEGSAEFEEGTQPRCNILNPKDDPTACKASDDLDPDLDPVEVTSECPWHYMANINKYRFPRKLIEAQCNPCGRCRDNENTECVRVNYTIPVLLAEPGPYDHPKTPCNYFFTSQHVSVGCTCALKSKPVVPPTSVEISTKVRVASVENSKSPSGRKENSKSGQGPNSEIIEIIIENNDRETVDLKGRQNDKQVAPKRKNNAKTGRKKAKEDKAIRGKKNKKHRKRKGKGKKSIKNI